MDFLNRFYPSKNFQSSFSTHKIMILSTHYLSFIRLKKSLWKTCLLTDLWKVALSWANPFMGNPGSSNGSIHRKDDFGDTRRPHATYSGNLHILYLFFFFMVVDRVCMCFFAREWAENGDSGGCTVSSGKQGIRYKPERNAWVSSSRVRSYM